MNAMGFPRPPADDRNIRCVGTLKNEVIHVGDPRQVSVAFGDTGKMKIWPTAFGTESRAPREKLTEPSE